MSLATAAFRFSALNITAPWRGPSTFPAGAIGVSERRSLDFMFGGLIAKAITASAGTCTMTGQAAALSWQHTVAAGQQRRYSALNPMCVWRGVPAFPDGSFTSGDRAALDGLYSSFAASGVFTIVASPGSFAMTGQPATLTPTTHIGTGPRRLAVLNIGNVWRGLGTYPTGAVGQSGRAGLLYLYSGFSSAFTYSLTANPGAYVWDGQPAFSDFEVSGISGVYTMTGQSATLAWAHKLVVSAGTYVMAGSSSNLAKLTTKTLFAGYDLYAMAGQAVTLTRPRTLAASAGQYSMTGLPILLSWAGHVPPRTLVAETGTYAMGGFPANFTYSKLVQRDPHRERPGERRPRSLRLNVGGIPLGISRSRTRKVTP